MTARVRKAVFPVAGLGTRFLPATKAMPKEMLTVVDRPVIQYVVDEARDAGIDNFIFVTGPRKNAIEEHFRPQDELAQVLEQRGKKAELKAITTDLPDPESLHFTTQEKPLGLGHAVLCARELVGNEPFALLLPDVLVQTEDKGCLAQMIDAYAEHGGNILAVEKVPRDRTKNYGIVSVDAGSGPVFPINGMVEKPAPGTEPSNLTILGRYILQPEIFAILERQETGAGGEIQLTDAMLTLLKRQPFYALECQGKVFDCGTPVGFLTANTAFATARSDLAEAYTAELAKLGWQKPGK
jgi:UTP--glucose-1-phosphate uridylyltransferase